MKTNQSKKIYASISALTCVSAALLYHGCSGGSSTPAVSLGVTTPPTSGTTLSSPVQIAVFQQGASTALFTATNSSTALVLTAGQSYNLMLTGTSSGSCSMTTLNIDLPSATPTTQTVTIGGSGNPLVMQPGDYTITLSCPGGQTQSFQASVACANPVPISVSGATASVTQDMSGPNNMFDFAISGITGGAPAVAGQPQYTCAWDFTGAGIIDTAFSDCSQGARDYYDNYVGTHAIRVLVKDSCNTTQAFTSSALTFNFTVPGTGVTQAMSTPPTQTAATGDTFIYGQTSNVTGSMASDPRVVETGPNNGYTGAPGITYLATNVNRSGAGQVQPMFSQGNGGASFTLKSEMQYGTTTSLNYGVQFNITGITGSFNTTTGASTLNAAAAVISAVSFTTDQAGDAEPAVTFQGTNSCTFTPGIKALFQAGQPCTGGTVGDNNQYSVEVWGPYSCTLTAPDGSTMTLTGVLDGIYDIIDSCSGGQQGSGGVTPINA